MPVSTNLWNNLLNIQQKDNKSIVTYKDTFEQDVEVVKTRDCTSVSKCLIDGGNKKTLIIVHTIDIQFQL